MVIYENCQVCSKKFIKKVPNHKNCSKKCANYIKNNRKCKCGNIKNRSAKTCKDCYPIVKCKFCKVKFTKSRKNQIYCSIICGELAIKKDRTDRCKCGNLKYKKANLCMKCYLKSPIKKQRARESLLKQRDINILELGFIPSGVIGTNENFILGSVEKSNQIKLIRQFQIIGYRIDGYCKELNTAFEIDEKEHSFSYKKKEDKLREQRIKRKLGCQFIRIKDY